MARRPFVAGNWKMNLNAAAGRDLINGFKSAVTDAVDVAVFPSYLSIAGVLESGVAVGAQDCFWMPGGAFTSRVSVQQLVDAGVKYCLIGHSETRGKFGKLEVPKSTLPYFAETDETINLKIRALVEGGVAPVLCVGETLEERKHGETDAAIEVQVKCGLVGLYANELSQLVVAYEPVWAIGTGETCDADEAQRVCKHVRAVLAEMFGTEFADGVRVLYGGSVKAANAAELFGQPDIDGGLVGGASLVAEEFAAIISAAS